MAPRSSPQGDDREVDITRYNLPIGLWQHVVRWAAKERRSNTNMVSILLEEAVKTRLKEEKELGL